MERTFQEHIQKRYPELLKERFLLACSGGLDSTVLVHLCHRNGLRFVLAHCNFNLRGTESDADELFVRRLAGELGVEILVKKFDTIGYKESHKVSLEMAARELRYAWFGELLQENQGEKLVTAHHADDALETFLINLSRGTGIQGLQGIPSEKTLLRPLLPFSRARILSFAQAEGIAWREDSSNQDTMHLRNKIRHEVVPRLKELHPTFLENFQRMQSHLSSTSKMVSDYVQALKSDWFVQETDYIRIPVAPLLQLEPLSDYLHALFHAYGFRAWEDIQDLLGGMSGKEVQSRTHRLVKDRDSLLLSVLPSARVESYEIPEGVAAISIPVHLTLTEVDAVGTTNPNILYVDKSALKYPLVVRNWKKGDYFYPFGMTGKKKLSKFFKDEKVDIITKEKQWLVCSGDDIVWVIGRRADNRYRVTDRSKHILRVTYVR